MFLISFLHQTTTFLCIFTGWEPLFLISFLHQTTTIDRWHYEKVPLFLISFLHQTTTFTLIIQNCLGCFLSHFYIKPQPNTMYGDYGRVVSYLISTSNHNWSCFSDGSRVVVSYLISTSNHNCLLYQYLFIQLFLISFLHQTTTVPSCICPVALLFLISFLHQTTTILQMFVSSQWLFLISFLHQTTTGETGKQLYLSCFLSHFYIKPQPVFLMMLIFSIITSKHRTGSDIYLM